MKSHFVKIMMLAMVLALGVTMVVVSAQGREGKQMSQAVDVQAPIDPEGLGDSPPPGLEVMYMFTGVRNRETADPEFATVVHCTNIGSSSVQVSVQFFDINSGIPAVTQSTIAPSRTRTFSTQSIASIPNEISPNPAINTNIQHGSGWVLAPSGSELICTAQVLGLDVSDVPTSMITLDLFRP